MEAEFGGKNKVYGPVLTDMKAVGKRTLEWDLNDWKWDGDLFLATPLNSAPSDCMSRQLFPLGPEIPANGDVSNSSSSCSEENNPTNEEGEREAEKRRRIVVVPEEELNEEAVALNLKLGAQVYPIAGGEVDKWEGKTGKKGKLAGTPSNRPVCQVEDCRADLSNAKDYHRRHKVCEVHSKASEALVGNVMQRFCQQCSRFHALQEFDEGKRSCRWRLAGHNKRRRKTNPETPAGVGPLIDEKSAGYLLISLLRVLSNLHASGSDQSKEQDLLSHLLGNLAGPLNTSNISRLVQGSQNLLDVGTSVVPEKDPSRIPEQCQAIPSPETTRRLPVRENQFPMPKIASAPQCRVLCPTGDLMPAKGNVQEANIERHMLNNIDLNNVYNDSEECVAYPENNYASVPFPVCGQDMLKSSPPQTSGNSESTSGRSSSSGSDMQSRTDRIVFKLFGKDPNDLPQLLRSQILDWLSHSPTEIEGYIRPGCIILTIYLRLDKSLWEEFCFDLSSSLRKLLDVSNDPFWKSGWIYTRVQQHAAFICDGRIILDTHLPLQSHRSRILSISPIAIPAAETVQLLIRGSNLALPTSRLFCAIEGKYLVQEHCCDLVGNSDGAAEQEDVQSLNFELSVPDVIGRGFIEVEDFGLTGCSFPFIVAEPEICSEICMLEKVMEVADTDDQFEFGECGKTEARDRALNFIHEMGWLLHRNHSRLKTGLTNPHCNLFSFERLNWMVDFSMDRDWCAVLKKLLDFLFSGSVDAGGHASVEDALSAMSLLHAAVRRNSRRLVELLLRYIPENSKNTSNQGKQQPNYRSNSSFFFRPDMTGAGGLTPLHIAASSEGLENVLEALLEDPGMVGIEAWRNAKDSTGLTPNDYASLRGHYSYIHLVQRKTGRKSSGKHVVVDIPSPSNQSSYQKQINKLKSAKVDSFYTEKSQTLPSCKLCELRPEFGYRRAALSSRPAILSLVAIAAVCVCTALLFKSSPRVCYIFGPFRWESLKYGAM